MCFCSVYSNISVYSNTPPQAWQYEEACQACVRYSSAGEMAVLLLKHQLIENGLANNSVGLSPP